MTRPSRDMWKVVWARSALLRSSLLGRLLGRRLLRGRGLLHGGGRLRPAALEPDPQAVAGVGTGHRPGLEEGLRLHEVAELSEAVGARVEGRVGAPEVV